jgi:hypothetical protein
MFTILAAKYSLKPLEMVLLDIKNSRKMTFLGTSLHPKGRFFKK